MEFPTALAGLDAHPWATVNHAYGPAEDLPDLLRTFTEGGEDAEDALEELCSSIVHQGTVYATSADAAPYLARIAACGRQTVDALRLLGCLAESEDEHHVDPGTAPPSPPSCRCSYRCWPMRTPPSGKRPAGRSATPETRALPCPLSGPA